MTLDLSKWGGSKLRKRHDTVIDPTPEGKEATGLYFPFVADMARLVNELEDRVAELEARPSTPFPG